MSQFTKSAEWISILMPVRNAEDFLRECLDSIINQIWQNWELIAVDDHSTDSSSSILKEYARTDRRIKVLENDGEGIIPALQRAFRNSFGKFITRMDADDIMSPRKLELLRSVLQNRDDLAIGMVKYISSEPLGGGYRNYESWLNELTRHSRNFQEMYKECTIPSPCWMIHRSTLDEIMAFDGLEYPEDYDLAFRFYESGLQLKPVTEQIHFWRDHRNRASRNDSNYADNRFLKLKIKRFLEIDRNRDKQFVLWGAGKKGKETAKLLQLSGEHFEWITNNTLKQGVEIYDKILESDENIFKMEDCQVLIAVAGVELNQIKEQVEKSPTTNEYFFLA